VLFPQVLLVEIARRPALDVRRRARAVAAIVRSVVIVVLQIGVAFAAALLDVRRGRTSLALLHVRRRRRAPLVLLHVR